MELRVYQDGCGFVDAHSEFALEEIVTCMNCMKFTCTWRNLVPLFCIVDDDQNLIRAFSVPYDTLLLHKIALLFSQKEKIKTKRDFTAGSSRNAAAGDGNMPFPGHS